MQLDGHFLARGAEHCKLAAEASLTPGARQLLENTATELLAAAEEAASRRDRGAAARQFQRAALHLEIVRLLGGKPLAPALEASRRYARWRARRLSHLLENCVLEHSPEDPRTFDAAYSLTGEILGRGGYGVVLGCTRRADQEAFACKRSVTQSRKYTFELRRSPRRRRRGRMRVRSTQAGSEKIVGQRSREAPRRNRRSEGPRSSSYCPVARGLLLGHR